MRILTLNFPEFSPWAFRIQADWFGLGDGSFGVRWYGLAYLFGLILAWRMAVYLVRKPDLWPQQQPPMKDSQVEMLLISMMVGIVLGGRLGFVVFYQLDYYINNPSEILSAWKGGMSFHGGLIGVVLATIFIAYRHGYSLLRLGDMIACVAPIGLLLGRSANFINAELYGRLWDGAWAVRFPQYWSETEQRWIYDLPASLGARHPSQLYEALLEGLAIFIILQIAIRVFGALRRSGLCIGLFLMLYAGARSVVELFRQPDTFLANEGFNMDPFGLGLTQGQMLSIPMILIGLGFVFYALFRTIPNSGK